MANSLLPKTSPSLFTVIMISTMIHVMVLLLLFSS